MNIKEHKSNIRTVRESDSDFRISDGMVIYPRAMLHVTPDCPHNIAEMISLASSKGWLKCVAHMYDSERMWEVLNDR
jgi:hypothetical protein